MLNDHSLEYSMMHLTSFVTICKHGAHQMETAKAEERSGSVAGACDN